jgi:hypothetical protein
VFVEALFRLAMNTSLASELSQRLSHELDQYAASLSVSQLEETESPSVEISENDEGRSSGAASDDGVVVRLSSALSKIRHQHGNSSGLSLKAVKSQAEAASSIQARIPQGDVQAATGNRAQTEQADQLQWILNSHIAIATWAAVFTSLMDQAEKVKEEEAYWQSVEGEDASGAMYLVQSECWQRFCLAVLADLAYTCRSFPQQSSKRTSCAFRTLEDHSKLASSPEISIQHTCGQAGSSSLPPHHIAVPAFIRFSR